MKTISVTTLVRYLKYKLDSDEALRNVYVSGELSNIHKTTSGHLYFTLKDEYSALSCVMFKSKAHSLTWDPENGNHVICQGSISIFEASGSLQLYVSNLKLDGIGDLYRQYEELKNKFFNEGLFDENHKKKLPTNYPSKVAVLCGKDSAALSDIKIQFKRRWPICDVTYYPVVVQGDKAAKDIVATLLSIDNKDYEIIVLARGGGSFEDLFCFNDENLIRTIYNLNTFIITGIGHQQDFTLADYVADKRAPTPTGAVEMITPKIDDVKTCIDEFKKKMDKAINEHILEYKSNLNLLENNKYLKNPALIIDNASLKLDFQIEKLKSFSNKIGNYKLLILKDLDKISLSIRAILNKNKQELGRLNDLLKAYSVDNILKRGFSIVYKDNKIIDGNIKINDELVIENYKNIIYTKVDKVKNKNG